MDLAVAEAAARLHVHRSRAEKMLRTGQLRGRKAGRIWFVDEQSVAELAARRRLPIRPMAPARAWGLLDLLSGGSGEWLSDVARSQVRARLRDLGSADADLWRALLRARNADVRVRVHPAVLARVGDAPAGRVLPAGTSRAVELGADLVAPASVTEIYVHPDLWPELEQRWRASSVLSGENLRVHLPRSVWPFHDQVGAATVAADLLDSLEPRAVDAGLGMLQDLWRAWHGG